jgi:dCTP diphosphatase
VIENRVAGYSPVDTDLSLPGSAPSTPASEPYFGPACQPLVEEACLAYPRGRSDTVTADDSTSIRELRERVAAFAAERDWDRFHAPKNLAMALAVEAAELMELFQWKTEEESWAVRNDPTALARVRDELADVSVFVLNLCNRLEIDLAEAVDQKLAKNAAKYPAAQAASRAMTTP